MPSTRMSRKPMSSVSLSCAGGEVDLVEFGRVGRPEGELCGFDGEGGAAVGIGPGGSIDACFRDVEGDGVPAGASSTWT